MLSLPLLNMDIVVSTIAENGYVGALSLSLLYSPQWSTVNTAGYNSHLVSVIAGDSSKADGPNQPLQEELQTVNNGVFFLCWVFPHHSFSSKSRVFMW